MRNTLIDAETIDLASYIDHALLLPTTTAEQVAHGCGEADRYNFAAVCVYPVHVRQAAELLRNRPVKVCSVIGFPTGATTSATKLYEAQEAVENGASELDVVINLGWLKAGQTDAVHQELAIICEETNLPVKAILETALLTPPELELACEICMDAGVTFLKTSTGWQGGATIEVVQQMRELTKGRVGIKASGGIQTVDQAVSLIQAGATRLGTSRGPNLIHQQQAKA
ncbi:deoxyribose-phosphate aldolase [Pseudanabaena sp. FACHB-2040]|uniref:deoxyribose-phosphate aldolase n=1 Tax=Pseudanabaena sp. FACHB-2040 TaxID=2692859 RepID=UPI0016864679|nr:deoxyribose-phosphate aldolase [Pseudanabaena sp. FACHB-2040]MBD2257932.1 deoxyribose-phosphate aldolase [Pseudanabaena sp. FACHB-2040]